MIIEHKKRNFKYYIDEDAFNFLVDWSEKNKPLIDGLMLSNSCYSDKAVIYTKTDSSNTVPDSHCYFEVKSKYIKAELKTAIFQNNGIYNGVKFKLAQKENIKENNYKLENDTATYYDIIIPYDSTDDTKIKIQLFSGLFTIINAFMFYGNITDDNHLKAIKQNDHIFFKVYQDKLYAIPTDKNSIHKSPEGIFSVRGHFRKYKSGKVVWISEYLKGLNK